MPVGKLRLKNDKDSSFPSTEKSKSKRSRQRHPTRSPSVDPTPPPYGYSPDDLQDVFPSGSSSASRAYSDAKGKRRATEPGDTRDELVVNWTTTSAQVANRLLSMPTQNDREFRLKLQDALGAEEDVRFESLLEEDQYLPQRWKSSASHVHARTDLDGHRLAQMEPEEYDEYVRKRMWSRTNRTHYLDSKDREERGQQARKRAREARVKQKLENEQRLKLRAERDARRQETKLKGYRSTYQQRWDLINALHVANETSRPNQASSSLDEPQPILQLDEIPWPIYPIDSSAPSSPLIDQLTPHSIKQFLVGHLSDGEMNARRKLIRAALLAYHPDRFERLITRMNDKDDDRRQARELGLRVSQILNELNQGI